MNPVGIYERVVKSVRKDRPGLPPEGLALPGAAASFTPGAADHRALRQKAVPPDPALVEEILSAARATATGREPSDEAIAALERALDRENAVALADSLVERIGSLLLDDWEPLYDALSAVALHTDRPQALKLALALLGPFEEEETVPFFRAMARHPEFSLFAVTALANDDAPAARAALVALLDETTGWAKVDVVERLLRLEDELPLGEALLTKAMDGLEEGEAASWIARGVAERCDLAGALASRATTRDTLAGACRLLARLAQDAVEGRPDSLDQYREREKAVAAFLERLPAGPIGSEVAEAAAWLLRWARARKRREVEEATEAYLERPDLLGAVIDDLLSRDPARRAGAAGLSSLAGMKAALGPLLETLVKHPEEDALVLAARELSEDAELKAVLRDAVPRMARAAKDRDPLVREAAEQALRRLRSGGASPPGKAP